MLINLAILRLRKNEIHDIQNDLTHGLSNLKYLKSFMFLNNFNDYKYLKLIDLSNKIIKSIKKNVIQSFIHIAILRYVLKSLKM